MRRISIVLLLLAMTSSAFAVVPQFWRVRTPDDYLAGEIDGFAINSRGELRLGPAVRKVVSFTDPFVLAQVTAPNGDRFFGTGNDGKVYRLRGTELKVIYTATEPEIYAVAFHDAALWIGTSPNGKIYRVDPESGKGTPFFDPKQAYIWSLAFAPNGDLLAGTGVDGQLYRIDRSGNGKVLFDATETHIRSLAVRQDGRILAGGSGQGRIYEIGTDGTARALFDSPLSEISTIYIDPSGTAWAAGVASMLPAVPPAKSGTAKPQATAAGTSASTSSGASTEKKESETATADVSFSFDDSSAAGASSGGASELYRIGADGFVETARKFDREMLYAISAGSNGSVLLATGPNGRIYEYRDHELSLVATVPEKQAVSISREGNETVVTTTNSGAFYRLGGNAGNKSEVRSAVKDAERFSRFGHYRVDGRNIGNGEVAISFRTGNTKTPDTTWSTWTTARPELEGEIGSPPARYIQWKLNAVKPSPGMIVDSITVAYVNRNMAPVVDSLSVADPGVVFITSSYPQSPQVVEATNPDEYGIFTSLENPRDKSDPGKKMFRKGYRTVTWRAHDDNGDSLRYSLSFRRKGAGNWLRLRDNMEETSMNFDTSQLPDGRYELRLSATDATDNTESAQTDVREGTEFVVDNSAPVIAVSAGADSVKIHVTDSLSTVGKVEYSIDAEKWTRLTPDDGLADSSDETYTVRRSDVAGHFVIVRAVDQSFNVATTSVDVK
jgi:WD40 repeat protein